MKRFDCPACGETIHLITADMRIPKAGEIHFLSKCVDVRHPIGRDGSYTKNVTYCGHCGNHVKDMKYCSNCGSRLNWAALDKL